MLAGDSVTAYAPKSLHASRVERYLDVNTDAKLVANGMMHFQKDQFAPEIAERTADNLKFLGVPSFGDITIDFSSHDPGLGSNLALSKHDKYGRNYGNGMHTDHDIDGHKLHKNIVFTTGTWWVGNKLGKAEGDMELIRRAFTEAYFIFPAYKIALDLRSHSFLMSLWRGGMDEHGTTRSNVDLRSGLTRWGCSCQTNWGMPTRIESETVDRRDNQGNLKPKPTRKGPAEMVGRRVK
ncbi:hypothetical protein FRC10_005612 [Ceratobasidium sp. 414]|nr:hypothetical protein FRC10_005612 [Ceratobasidium sp. 414]